MRFNFNTAFAALLGGVSLASTTHAEEGCLEVERGSLVSCVLARSLDVSIQSTEVDARRGRKLAAGGWLPSNPVLSFSVARRDPQGSGGAATNWYATLEQEVEIAGQQVLRAKAAGYEMRAEQHRLRAIRRDVAALAWQVYFEALATHEGLALARKLEHIQTQIAEVATARAQEGLNARVDADLAHAAMVKATQNRFDAERAKKLAVAWLHILYGREPWGPQMEIKGQLKPLDAATKIAQRPPHESVVSRPTVAALRDEERGFATRASALRRARVPNPTVSLYAQDDGFDEKVFGVGLSVPITLPSPVGKSFSGEAAEAESRSQQASLQAKSKQLSLKLELYRALTDYRTREQQVAAQSYGDTQRARRTFEAIAEEVRVGHMMPRDALNLQKGLTEFLLNDVSNRLLLALASVRLAHAAGMPLEKGVQ